MNANDIEFIHKLLIRQEASCKKAVECAKNNLDDPPGGALGVIEAGYARRVYEEAMAEYDEVCQALRSFELKEWN